MWSSPSSRTSSMKRNGSCCGIAWRTSSGVIGLSLHPSAARIGGGQGIVRIGDALERADARALHGVDRCVIDEQRRVTDHHRGAGLLELGVAAHVDLGAYTSVVRADLPR